MKNKLKYGLTLAALTFLVGCGNKGSIQRPSIGSGPTVQDSSSITSSKTSTSSSNNSSSSGDSSDISSSDSTDSNTSDATSDSTSSEIDPFELSSYQYYPLPDKTLAIAVGNNKYLEKLTLPEQYQGRKVTQIVENGFEDCKALREISIPSSVLAIGYAAFSGCSSLTSIVIPEGVTNIGAHAFGGCTSLTSVVIPDGVTNIGYLAFSGCSSLTGIVIPKGVTTIGATAFYNCSSLTIYCQAQSRPSGWDDNWVGYGCPVVWGCIRAGNQDCFEYAVISIEGAESATVIGYTGSDTSITVPKTIGGVKVTAIANSAFAGCTSLTSIVMPESVTSIGNSTFSGCSALSSIVIPNSVTNIGDEAFCDCSSLAEIAIPNSVTAIGDWAFSGCTSLNSIVIPNSVTTIEAYAFSRCSSLTIYCQAQSKPSGWHFRWNDSDCPVVWGYSGNGTSGSLN